MSRIVSLAIPNTFPVSWDFVSRGNSNDEEVRELYLLLVFLEII